MHMVRSFCEDHAGNLWIATKGGGVAMLGNSKDSDFKITTEYNTNNGLLNNDAYVIKEGFDGDLFIGTDGQGLNILVNGHLSTLNLKNIYSESSGQKIFSGTYAIHCSEKDSTLWLGTSEYGLIRIKIQKQQDKTYKAISYKQYIHQKTLPTL